MDRYDTLSLLQVYLYFSHRYKERLETTYIKSRKPTDTNKNLVGKNWLFMKDGLDDFRDGLPPPVDGDITLKVIDIIVFQSLIHHFHISYV